MVVMGLVLLVVSVVTGQLLQAVVVLVCKYNSDRQHFLGEFIHRSLSLASCIFKIIVLQLVQAMVLKE